MRNYQPKKNNPYLLPHNLYMRTLYLVKDYDRLKKEYHDIIDETPPRDGQPRGTDISDPTAQKAIKLELIFEQLKSVEQAQVDLPDKYKNPIFNNICYGVQYPDDKTYDTYRAWRQRFIYRVAERMKWI